MAADSISSYGRGAQGVRVVGLKDGDAVISAAWIDDSDENVTDKTDTKPESDDAGKGENE